MPIDYVELHCHSAFSLLDGTSTPADLVAQARAFGFHLATLDIRQHSDEHGRALGEMLRAAGLLEAGVQYNDLPEEEKMRLLQRELVNPRPLLARDAVISESARNVLDVFHVVREAQRHLAVRQRRLAPRGRLLTG